MHHGDATEWRTSKLVCLYTEYRMEAFTDSYLWKKTQHHHRRKYKETGGGREMSQCRQFHVVWND